MIAQLRRFFGWLFRDSRTQIGGSQNGPCMAGGDRRAEMAEDYSLAAMVAERRRANGGAELTPEQMAETKALHDRIAAADAKIAALEQAKAEAESLEGVDRVIASVRKKIAAERALGLSPKNPEYGANNRIVTRDAY